MRKMLNTSLFLILLLAGKVFAVTAWTIIPSESSLTFTATQNNAPVNGKFTHFTGEINFDPEQLDKSHVKIIVDVASISDPYQQLADTLKTPEWFNAKVFPKAIFESSQFKKTGETTYQAQGKLTLRDKTQPIILNFTQDHFSPTKAKMRGTTTIKRTAFGIGQGEWADTNTVKDEVKINFTISAKNP